MFFFFHFLLYRKKAMEAELLRSKTEMMLLNNQLLEAVQKRLELALEVEDWKVLRERESGREGKGEGGTERERVMREWEGKVLRDGGKGEGGGKKVLREMEGEREGDGRGKRERMSEEGREGGEGREEEGKGESRRAREGMEFWVSYCR